MSTPISNHSELALARLITQYKDKPRLASFITAFVEQIQEIEDALNTFGTSRNLSDSVGVQLDLIGSIVGAVRRSGQSDSDFRILVKCKIIQNLSNGEPERLIQVYQLLMNSSQVYLSEHFPAAVSLHSDVALSSQEEANIIIEELEKIAAGGVKVEYLESFDSSNPFAFEGPLPGGAGFGDIGDASVGGEFATLWTYVP